MNDHDTPNDLRPIERALDGLAASERAAAPASLEDRIALATGATIAGAPPAVAARIGFRAKAMALAACMGVAALAAAYFATRTAPIDNDIIVRLASFDDDYAALLDSPLNFDPDERLAALDEELRQFEASLGAWSIDDDLFDLSTLEGTPQ